MPHDIDRNELLANCQRIDLAFLGAIQSHGALIAIDIKTQLIEYASDNIGEILGATAEYWLSQNINSRSHCYFEKISPVLNNAAITFLKLDDIEVRISSNDSHYLVEFCRASPVEEISVATFNQWSKSMLAATSPQALHQVTMSALHEVIGFDHVMVYRFDNKWNGQVIEEWINPLSENHYESYQGLCFPESDIPVQARAMYLQYLVRNTADVNTEAVLLKATLKETLGLGSAYLRRVAPSHIQYLKNMNVTASFSLSIIVDGTLWGLIAAHHATARPLSLSALAATEEISKLYSSLLTLALRNEHHCWLDAHANLLNSPTSAASRGEDALAMTVEQLKFFCDVFDAHAAVAWDGGIKVAVGDVPDELWIARLVDSLRSSCFSGYIYHSTQLNEFFPELKRHTMTGVLAISAPIEAGRVLLLLRKEEPQEVRWSGDPRVEAMTIENNQLSPRNSFNVWKQTLSGVSRPWTESQCKLGYVLAENFIMANALLINRKTLQDAYLYTKAILDNMRDAVITMNLYGDIEIFNQAANSIFGYGDEEVIGKNITFLMANIEKDERNEKLFDKIVENGVTQLEGIRKDGSVFFMAVSISTLFYSGRTTYICLLRDITLERERIEEIHRLAFFDPLTELPNRRLLSDRLSQAIVTAARTNKRGALMFIDLDHFKQLNDTLGHDVGDALLKQVGTRLQKCVREGDTVARMGGDEFVVLLEDLSIIPIDAASQAENIAKKILYSLVQPYNLGDHAHISTASIGVVVFHDKVENTDELFKKADVAMYQAKATGRNAIRFFDKIMQAALLVRVELETNMRLALARNEFVLHYQVQVNECGAPVGAEALVRWRHSKHGIILPASFIAMAEETRMILPLGQWVLEAACLQLVEWSKDPFTAHWTIAVNVSASQFTHADFADTIKNVLQKTGAKPELLKLELTESLLVNDIEDVIDKMTSIKECGITFSLDDFGTGYSSLNYLKRLPLDQLKIDQSFVRDLLIDRNDEAIARTIVTLGHSMGLQVVAEGVETLEQKNFLATMGCDAYQGYYFGRPVAATELIAVIRQAVFIY